MRCILVLLALASVIGLGHLQDMPQPGVCGVSSIQPSASTRIVNGEAAIPHSRPYQLLLVGFFPNGTAKHYCGASLVKPTHVLTAAHCVAGDTAENVRVYPGVHYFSSSVLTMENGLAIRQIFMHESYAAQSLNNDVAVLRLQKAVDVDFEKVGLICLPSLSSDPCKPGDAVVGRNRSLLVFCSSNILSLQPVVGVRPQEAPIEPVPADRPNCNRWLFNALPTPKPIASH